MTTRSSPTFLYSPASDERSNSLGLAGASQTAPSVISSKMSDIPSDDFREDSNYGGSLGAPPRRVSPRPPTVASTLERSADRSRPSTSATGTPSQRANWPQRPPSRKTHTSSPSANAFRLSAQGRASPSSLGANRPPSAASRPQSAASRSHVPSLTSHAFFRPMSSQRLQAQRAVRLSRTAQSGPSEDGYSELGSNQNRLSLGSNPGILYEHDDLAPPSRDTEITDRDGTEQPTSNGTITRNGTVQSVSDSTAPLQGRFKNVEATLAQNQPSQSTHVSISQPPRSPKSFRSKILSNRGAVRATDGAQGRDGLSSSTSSALRKSTQEIRPAPGRNFEYFTGNTVFCWGGRLQNTRDRPINIATGLLVFIPGGLFFGLSAPWLWHNVSPAIPILFAYIFLICISSFIHASVSDPGILPRNLHPYPPPALDEDPLTLGPPTTGWTTIKSATNANSAMEVPTKYCKTCNIWRPPRAHHCRVCNNCIETQDHHCVWLNNCVGRRNYRYFFVFVCSATLCGIYLFGASLAHLLIYRSRQDITFGQASSRLRGPMALVVYALLATPYPAALWGYHSFLLGRGETTREYLNSHKFPKKDRHRPYTHGSVFRNWMAVLGRPRPPTYLRFKRKYEDGDQRFGPRRGNRTAPLTDQQQGGGIEMSHVNRQGP